MANGRKTPIKPTSRPTEFKELSELPPEVLAEVKSKLTEGISTYQVADFIHKQGHCLDHEVAALARELRRWANKAIPLIERVLYHKPGSVKRMLQRVEGMTEEIEQFCDLIQIQRDRIEKALVFEANLQGMPVKDLTDMIEKTGNLVEKVAQLKMDLGLAKRDPTRISLEADVVARVTAKVKDPSLMAVLQNPASRAKLYDIAQRIIGAARKGRPLPIAPLPPNGGTTITVNPG